MAHNSNTQRSKRSGLVARGGMGLLIAGMTLGARAGEVLAQAPPGLAGIDVSQWQGSAHWNEVKQSGIAVAYANATGGITFTDPEFVNNWHGMRESGIVRGAYHFFYAKDDPEAQAEHFVQTLQTNTVKADDLPPVLDLEITDGMNTAQIASGALRWLQIVEEKLGQKPNIYTDLSFANTHLTDPAFAGYRLWIAEYGVATATYPQTWSGIGWSLWQHSETGAVPGIVGHVDLDVFDGTQEQLMALIRDSATQ